MPTLSINGARLYYEEQGQGPETLVFGHGLLWSGAMFRAQVEALQDRYRCITLDWRGQGRSEVTAGGYDMDSLTEDAAALIEHLNAAPCHYVGLSMGGFIGMRLAIRRPELLKSLTLMETSADPEPAQNVPRYRLLGWIGRLFGFRLTAGPVMAIMFGQEFIHDPARAEERRYWRERLIANDRVGILRALDGVINRQGVYDQLDRLALPTLIVVGDQDVATTPDKARRIHARIAGSQLVIIPGAGHSSSVEKPAMVTAALESFLAGLGAPA